MPKQNRYTFTPWRITIDARILDNLMSGGANQIAHGGDIEWISNL